jgi:hypothetical protein
MREAQKVYGKFIKTLKHKRFRPAHIINER